MAYCHVSRAMAQREAWIKELEQESVEKRKGFVKLIAVGALHLLAITAFTSGFLLSRKQVDTKATTSVLTAGTGSSSSPSQYDKVVLLVIDALRSDFVCIPNNRTEDADVLDERWDATKRHRRTLGIFEDLSRRRNCEVFEFEADAPTTTMQRLQGLMTGSLPTFVDIGSSLSAKRMSEDNVVYQMKQSGKRVAVMGDETWTDLFPEHFSEQHPFPSMEVNDLHSVDNEIIKRLVPKIRSESNWDVLIAHFLGVDHAGHTFDINSHHMLDKLEQMDQVIREVVGALEEKAARESEFERTLLLVMGDHGQTETGEHGGNSHQETSTILMAYNLGSKTEEQQNSTPPKKKDIPRKSAAAPSDEFKCPQFMSQLDFAATLSAVLGLPIPFSNVGQVSWDLWTLGLHAGGGEFGEEREEELLDQFDKILVGNIDQVNRYISSYLLDSKISASNAAKQFLAYKDKYESELGKISSGNDDGGDDHRIRRKVRERQQYLDAVAGHARRMWTTFDFRLMALGAVISLAAASIQLWDTKRVFLNSGMKSQKHAHALILYGLVMAMLSASMLSNSYILSEGSVVCFLIATLLFYLARETADATNSGAAQASLAGLLLLNALMCNLIPEHSGDIWNGNTQKSSTFQVSYLVSDAVFLVVMALGMIQGALRFNPKGSLFLYNSCLALLYSFLKNNSTGRQEGEGEEFWRNPNNVAKQIHALTLASLLWCGFEKNSRKKAIRALFFLLPELYIVMVTEHGRLGLGLAYIEIYIFIILLVKVQFVERRIDLEMLCVALLSLYCKQIFSATGHQAQFSALQYNAAFVGFSDFNWWRGAALLALNTFGGSVCVAHLLACVYAQKTGQKTVARKTVAYSTFGLTFSLTHIFVMLCCMIHCRHLMVWGVFAPKFIFSSLGLLLLDVVLWFTYTFL